MTNHIKNIFEQNIQLIGEADKSIYYFRQQQYDKALGIVTYSLDRIKTIIEAIIMDRNYFASMSAELVLDMLSKLLEAKKNNDYILFADLLEVKLMDFLYQVQKLIISKEDISFDKDRYQRNVSILMQEGNGISRRLMDSIDAKELLDKGYRVECTSCGLMTLAAQNEGSQFYFHTNNRVQLEAFLLVLPWIKGEAKRYIIYGYGMGYHIKELLALAPEAEVEVYEGDINVLQLACAFTDIRANFDTKRLKLIYDPDYTAFERRISSQAEGEELYLHYPSVRNIRDRNFSKWLKTKVPWTKNMDYGV